MGKSTGDLKNNNKSFRLTDKELQYIKAFAGDGLNQKLENLILFCMESEREKKDSIEALEKEIERLTADRAELLSDMKQLKSSGIVIDNILNNLHQLEHKFAGESMEKNQRAIKKDLLREGFCPNSSLVNKLDKLVQVLGRSYSVRDIAEAYKNKSLKENPDAQKLAEDIGRELKEQEMARTLPQEPEP